MLDLFGDLQDLEWFSDRRLMRVDADDVSLARVKCTLLLVGGVRDLADEPAAVDPSDDSGRHRATVAQLLDLRQQRLDLGAHLVGQ